ncbi:unnamed protein product [Blepharisma stoltei]|uniref:UDENN domain-containing protein n=1 Tax=Blepharisma stoltei TaxID=1481888 RepID=A0AAU9IGK4_9CILI|nr:unnamed protein product [Blepharisma stoltei]
MEALKAEIQEYCKDISTLADYFVTIGMSLENIKNHVMNNEALSPIILSQFPPIQREGAVIPAQLPMFCFPWGAEIVKGTTEVPSSLFNLVLTDEQGHLLYCTCLKVYEAYFHEEPSEGSPSRGVFKRADTRAKTGRPDTTQFPSFEMVEIEENENPFKKRSFTLGNLDELEGEIPNEEEVACMIPSFSFFCPTGALVPKCLVIVSRHPYFETFKKILNTFYKMSSARLDLPLECYISHFILQVPLPSRGHVEILYQIEAQQFRLSLPAVNRFPLLDINLGMLFYCLDLENMLFVFRCIATEQPIVFVSNNEDKLCTCTYALLALIFPFHWSLVYVPLLPEQLLDYLYSPVNYIYGVNIRSKEAIYNRCSETAVIVDLDNNKIECPFYTQNHTKKQTLPNLPEHYGKKLTKRIVSVLSKAGAGKSKPPKLSVPRLDEFATKNIREAFFQFFVSIFISYKKFLNYDWNENDNSSFFDRKGFLASVPENARFFLGEMIKSQTFANFCATRLRPRTIEEHCEGLLFDEHIIAKNNRSKLKYNKVPAPFISDQSQELHSKYQVPLISQVYVSKKEHTYNQFPDFDMNVFQEYGLPLTRPPKYSDNIDIPSPPQPSAPPTCKTDIECILSCWVEMWAACLWYQHEEEQSLRLKEALQVLELINSSFNGSLTSLYKLLFEACLNVNPSLALPIFSVMNTLQVMVDAGTVHLVQRVISKLSLKPQDIEMRKTRDSLLVTNSLLSDSTNLVNRKRRIFTRPGDIHIFAKQEVCFLVKELCKKCGKQLSLEEIKHGWRRQPYDYQSLCNNCQHGNFPQLRIRVGLEVGHISQNKTSSKEDTLFVSPQTLKALVTDILNEKDNKFHLNIEAMRVYNPMIFWNLVWHFNNLGLTFEFILPYEKDTENKKFFALNTDDGPNKQEEMLDGETQTLWSLEKVSEAIQKYNELINEIN